MTEGMAPDEAAIICGAVADADCWGAGRLTVAKERIEDAGFVWTDIFEDTILEYAEGLK